jgi:hypothetical protein
VAIQIQSYDQRVATPSVGGTPQLRAVNQPVIDISGSIDKLANTYDKIEDDAAETEAMKAVARTRMDVEEAYRGAQEKVGPGADNFTPMFMGLYEGHVTKTADGLSSELARKKYSEKMLGFGVSLQDRSITWEADQRRTERKRSFTEAADNHASTLFSTDAADRETSFNLMRSEIETSLESVDLPPDAKADLREKIKTKMSYAAVQGDLRDRPEAVQDWLIKGEGSPYYSKLRATESGGKNIGSSTSSGFGPYQFLRGTWKALINKHPEMGLTEKDRYDPISQEVAIRAFTDDNAKVLKANGMPATNANLYMMHFLGEQGGVQFLKATKDNPNDPASLHVNSAAVAANGGVFKNGRTVQDVYKLFALKFGMDDGIKQPAGSPSYYGDLNFQSRNTLYDQADAELRKRRSEGAAAFKQTVDNTIAQYAANGFSTDAIGEQQFVAAMGAPRGTVAYGDFVAATIGAKAQHDLRTLDINQHGQYLEGLRPDEADPNYAEKLKGFEAAKSVSVQVRNAIKEDAAGYVSAYNPNIQQQLAAVANLEGSDDTKRGDAAASYLAQLNQEYDRLGVPAGQRRTVPKAYADQVGGMLQAKLSSDAGATQTVAMLNRYAQAWGPEWPKVYSDLSEKMSAPLKVITSGVQPAAATILASVATQSFDDLAKTLGKTDKMDITTGMQEAFQPFVQSTGFQASSLGNVSDFHEQGRKLAAVYKAQGMTASDAATKAYDDIVGFKYRMVNDSEVNVRIPKPVDVPGMEAAIRKERDSLIRMGDVMLGAAPSGVSMTDEERASRTRSWLDRNAKWVTKPDDSGLALMVGTQVWRDSQGNKIEKPWSWFEKRRTGEWRYD